MLSRNKTSEQRSSNVHSIPITLDELTEMLFTQYLFKYANQDDINYDALQLIASIRIKVDNCKGKGRVFSWILFVAKEISVFTMNLTNIDV